MNDFEKLKERARRHPKISDCLNNLDNCVHHRHRKRGPTYNDARLIRIDGIIEIPADMTNEQWLAEFIGWLEANGWAFGGATKDMTEEDDDESTD